MINEKDIVFVTTTLYSKWLDYQSKIIKKLLGSVLLSALILFFLSYFVFIPHKSQPVIDHIPVSHMRFHPFRSKILICANHPWIIIAYPSDLKFPEPWFSGKCLVKFIENRRFDPEVLMRVKHPSHQ